MGENYSKYETLALNIVDSALINAGIKPTSINLYITIERNSVAWLDARIDIPKIPIILSIAEETLVHICGYGEVLTFDFDHHLGCFPEMDIEIPKLLQSVIRIEHSYLYDRVRLRDATGHYWRDYRSLNHHSTRKSWEELGPLAEAFGEDAQLNEPD